MNDRTFKALARAGMKETTLASLDYEQKLFVLTTHHLVFEAEEGGQQQLVALRDITRIHSDETGTLRVETGPRTAIMASLLGFNADRVQQFFQLVRDTTARAKQLPPSPTPEAAPSFLAKEAPAPTPSHASTVTTATTATAPRVKVPLAEQLAAADLPAPTLTPLNDLLAAAPLPPVKGLDPLSETANAIQIQAEAPKDGAPLPAVLPVSDAGLTIRANPPAPKLATNLPDSTSDKLDKLDTKEAITPSSPNSSSSMTQELSGPLSQNQMVLLNKASSVSGLSGTVRVLALVLVIGALGMGYVMWQKQDQQIPALWIVTIGIVTAVALLVLAEVLRYLAALGESIAQSQSNTAQGKGR